MTGGLYTTPRQFFSPSGKQKILEFHFIIPENFLNIKLTKDDKEKLLDEIGYPKGWTTLKKSLIKQGYEVKDSASKGVRYSIISISK